MASTNFLILDARGLSPWDLYRSRMGGNPANAVNNAALHLGAAAAADPLDTLWGKGAGFGLLSAAQWDFEYNTKLTNWARNMNASSDVETYGDLFESIFKGDQEKIKHEVQSIIKFYRDEGEDTKDIATPSDAAKVFFARYPKLQGFFPETYKSFNRPKFEETARVRDRRVTTSSGQQIQQGSAGAKGAISDVTPKSVSTTNLSAILGLDEIVKKKTLLGE